MKRNSGLLISFEGGEGAGKTVQIKLLADEFKKRKHKILLTREPGGTVISEQIREVILNTKNTDMCLTAEVLLFQAARAQIYDELILPALKVGKIVLSDRTGDSSLVYQSLVRGFDSKLISRLNRISTQNTFPDLTFLLDIPVEIGLARRNGTEEINRLDLEKREFHEKVRMGYIKLAKENDHNRWEIINAIGSIEQVHKRIMAKLKERGIF